jgi:PEGA domain
LTQRTLLSASLCSILLISAISTVADAASSAAPIVAVFDIQATSVPSIKPETLQAMTDFLNAKLVASGRMRTVPRAQVKRRLSRLKVESYKECHDQACQIELGRELAANKSLSTKVHRAGQRCALSLELYDLTNATTEAAHTELVECGEGPLYEALSRGVGALLHKVSRAASRPAVERPKVSVYISSAPGAADVLVDGLYRGKTPLRLALELDRRHELALVLEDYAPAKRSVVASGATRLHVPLRLTAEGRVALATTSEWIGLGFGPGYLAGNDSTMLAISMRMGNIKWRRLFWTLVDFNALMDMSNSGASAVQGDNIGAMIIGTRPGFPLYLGSRGQHQLLFGVGFNYTALLEHDGSDPSGSATSTPAAADAPSFFALSPGVDYVYNLADGTVPLGIGVRANLPVAGNLGDGRYPYALMASVNIGFSLYRLLRKASRRRSVPAQAEEHDAERE